MDAIYRRLYASQAVKGRDVVCSMGMVDVHVDVTKHIQVWLRCSLWIINSITPYPDHCIYFWLNCFMN